MPDHLGVQYFQATATIIPVLAVAAVVTLRGLTGHAAGSKPPRGNWYPNLFGVLVVAFGEICSLRGIARGGGDPFYAAFPVNLTIGFLLAVLYGGLIRDDYRYASPRTKKRLVMAGSGIMIGFGFVATLML